mgnify:CR=1 FL=1
MIPRSFIQQLVGLCEIEDVVSSYVTIRRAGRNPKGLCPFHSEKTPSFVLYPDNQSFYCFGCGAGGDVISFIMRAENLDYVEAVRFLAKRVGLEVPDEGEDSSGQLKARILEINRETARFFYQCLKSPAGRPGMEYLREKRGLSMKTITSYGLGYAPDSWDSLLRHLHGKGFRDEEMAAACVAAKGRNGRYYDQFRNRVMFPIIDLRGNVIAFGGRVLDDSKPKYLNSPDTPVFKKSRNLFSLNFAKNAADGRLILAEGYMDVIAIHAAGFPNVVATLGTSLTEEQARLMSKYAKEILIAYDSDGAGQTATHRAINLLSDAGLNTKVIRMEGAKDPDEYLKKFGPTRFRLLLDSASNVIEHELEELKAQIQLDTAEGRIDYLKRAIHILADIKNPLEREVFAGIVAKEAGVMPEAVLSQTSALMKKRFSARERQEWREIEQGKANLRDRINPEKAQNLKEAMAEEGILAYLIQHPDQIQPAGERLEPADFVTGFGKRVLESVFQLARDGDEVNITALGTLLTPQETGGLARILARYAGQRMTKEMLDDYIDILRAHKDKLQLGEIREIEPDAIEEYRRRLRQKK